MSTESQLLDTELRCRVRARIENGQLPAMVSESIFGRYGSGHVCVACDQPITGIEVEYEFVDYRDGVRLCLHLGCHAVWQIECARRASPTPARGRS
jgi:hypothetical protein